MAFTLPSALPLANLALLSALFTTAGAALIAIYRLYLHPLSRIPGPRLAAITGLYEAYFDLLPLRLDGGGRFWVQINKLHDIYGPIVRINPWEVHIRDPAWAASQDGPYRYGLKSTKPRRYYAFMGNELSLNSAVDHSTWRMRRDAVQPFYSAGQVVKHGAPEVETIAGRLVERLREKKGTGEAVALSDAYRALTTDSAAAFIFDGANFGHVDSPDFMHQANISYRNFARAGLLARQIPGLISFIRSIVQSLPESAAPKDKPSSVSSTKEYFKKLSALVEKYYEPSEKASDSRNLVGQILQSNLPPHEKELKRVARECSMMILAGIETAGSAMTAATFYLLSDSQRLQRLQDELQEAEAVHGQAIPFPVLKDLPFLTAVINETLRLGNNIFGRLARSCPTQDLRYGEFVLPRGTTISTTQRDAHLDETIFPSPNAFMPERWLDGESGSRGDIPKAKLKDLHAFGRGNRACVGAELANADMYITLARLLSPSAGFRLELYDTDAKDVEPYFDYFLPMPLTTNGLRVKVL